MSISKIHGDCTGCGRFTKVCPCDAPKEYALEDEITCPYCGVQWLDSWEHTEDEDLDCEDCGGVFKLTVNYSVTYSTKPLKKGQETP